jgi:ubiquinone/menaquinone biosynthesis C-methylase UbiE
MFLKDSIEMLEPKVIKHYQAKKLPKIIYDFVNKEGSVNLDELNTYDEFHIGGREATSSLISHFEITDSSLLLDLGCGIGGPARYITSLTGATITGIDLTPEFIAIANELSRKTGLSHKVSFECANALDLPFQDLMFDGVIMFHVGMNISNKVELYKQAYRILKPGGFFGIYDIFGNDNQTGFTFPVPWADTKDTSFLIDIDEANDLLTKTGFVIKNKIDKHDYALKTFSENEELKKRESLDQETKNKFAIKLANLAYNVENFYCSPWEVICFKPE